ncbi:DUF1292 domain-containing protein [Clostridium oryzae]|uniref:Uncharacterized protein n=1 Tax=Clostridium oryzae TaxID=1450648 RepID=A0A1V4II22_9CLOT|nr:DUF1292 domain-containing protein [Clostridium oryzae]OPJ59576.1 hypothetical protein CLORY_32230 [Clostridium oryzae]
MEEKKMMAFRDEDGNKVEFEVVAEIYLNNNKYIILSSEEDSDQDAFVFRVDGEGEDIEYNMIEDDREFDEVKKEYQRLLNQN